MKKLLSLIVLGAAVTFLSGACTPKRPTMAGWYRDGDAYQRCSYGQYWDGYQCVGTTSGSCGPGMIEHPPGSGYCHVDPNCAPGQFMVWSIYGGYYCDTDATGTDGTISNKGFGDYCNSHSECRSNFCAGGYRCSIRGQVNNKQCFLKRVGGEGKDKDKQTFTTANPPSEECISEYCDFKNLGDGTHEELACGLKSHEVAPYPNIERLCRQDGDYKCQSGDCSITATNWDRRCRN